MPYKDEAKQREAQRKYYDRNKAKVLQTSRDRRSHVLKFLQEYKQSRGCMDCEIEYPYWVLQFDHRPGEGKAGNIADIMRSSSFEAVKEEIAKCDVVCANCHADRTHDRLVKHGADVMTLEGQPDRRAGQSC